MADKIYALDLDKGEWSQLLDKEFGQPKFRAGQICQWIWQKRVFDAAEMTNLSKPLRDALEKKIEFGGPLLIKEQRSQTDGTRKYLWQLSDGQSVESVLMKQGERLTACISTQVGCPLGCTFCATGLSGYVRNLSAGEIAGQFIAMEKAIGREIGNVVYMGMGEPFLNTEAVLKSVRMLNDPAMRNLGIRHIAISTSGIVPGILELAASGLGVRLAVSLHAAEDELRSTLMPVNETFPLDDLRKAMQDYQRITGNRITIEYALFGGVNDSVEHARLLLRYLRGIHVFVNLIPYNSVDGRYERPSAENILKFRSVLETAGFEAEIREELGSDIDAACGQLRRNTKAGEPRILEPAPRPAAHNEVKNKVSRPPKKETAALKKTKASPGSGKVSGETGQKRERAGTKASGGFVDERGPRKPAADKRRKADAPSKERYRSGKMKEERPVYRAGADENADDRPAKPTEKRTGELKRAPKSPAADKRRKTDAPPKERYRSGKMKEERPVYRAGADENANDRPAKPTEKRTGELKRAPKKPAAARPDVKGKPAPEKRKKMPKTASRDKRPKRS